MYYSVYDVTDPLRQGRNVLGAVLGNGWYNLIPMEMFGQFNFREILPSGKPKLLAQLTIEYADGTRTVVGTNPSWQTDESALLRNDIYLGEVYDARKEQTGWDRPGFDDTGWQSAVQADAPAGSLQAQPQAPIRVTRRLKPVRITEPAPDTFVVDFGQNFAGWMRMNVEGPAGTVLESGHSARKAEGVEFVRTEDGAAVCRLGAGRYRFTVQGFERPSYSRR